MRPWVFSVLTGCMLQVGGPVERQPVDPFLRAVREGQVERVRALIDSADVRAEDQLGYNALVLWVQRYTSTEVPTLLLERAPDLINAGKHPAIEWVQDEAMREWLIARGAVISREK